MVNTYPVQGYRNQAAKAWAAAGVQSPRPALPQGGSVVPFPTSPDAGSRLARQWSKSDIRLPRPLNLPNLARIPKLARNAAFWALDALVICAASPWLPKVGGMDICPLFWFAPAEAPGPDVFTVPTGWSKVGTCGGIYEPFHDWKHSTTTGGCGASAWFTKAQKPYQSAPVLLPGNVWRVRWWVQGDRPGMVGSANHVHYSNLYHSDGVVDSTPNPDWVPQPAVPPVIAPLDDPVPHPPYRTLPYRQNSVGRQAGYRAAPAEAPVPVAPPLAPPAAHRPPGRRTRERKWVLMGHVGVTRALVEAAFEGLEWLDILLDALPKNCQVGPSATGAEKFMAIYTCSNGPDMCKVIEGGLNNFIEDAWYGAFGQAAKRQAQEVGKAYGMSGLSKKLGDGLPIPKINLGCQ